MIRVVSQQLPLRSTATLAALPAMSLIPVAPFTVGLKALDSRRGRYPWAMAPTTIRTKPVATAMATLISIDKLTIFPFIMAATSSQLCVVRVILKAQLAP